MGADIRSDSTKAHDGPDEVVVWRVVSRHVHRCDMYKPHVVETWVSKRLTRAGTYEMNNGYERRMMPFYVDRQGRVYRAHLDIDFHASTRYIEQTPRGSRHWVRHPSSYDRVAVDIFGRLLEPNKPAPTRA